MSVASMGTDRYHCRLATCPSASEQVIILILFPQILCLPKCGAAARSGLVWAYVFDRSQADSRQYKLLWDVNEYAAQGHVSQLVHTVTAKIQVVVRHCLVFATYPSQETLDILNLEMAYRPFEEARSIPTGQLISDMNGILNSAFYVLISPVYPQISQGLAPAATGASSFFAGELTFPEHTSLLVCISCLCVDIFSLSNGADDFD